jgi:hypothetical protein
MECKRRADTLSPGDFEGPAREQRRWAIIFRLAALCVSRVSPKWLSNGKSVFSSHIISTQKVFMERRAAPRRPVLMSGVIKFADGTADCLICDMSISGAAIEVTGPQVIPERFDLVFKGDDTPLPCYVVWRRANRIGVAFE